VRYGAGVLVDIHMGRKCVTAFILLIVAGALLVGLLWAEHVGGYSHILLFKAPLSCLFVLTALLQSHPVARYYRLVLAGLVLGLVGDVCLALPGDTAFRAGLAAFLAGHVLYVLAMASLTRRTDWVHAINLVILAVSGYVFWWLLPHLGQNLVPVALYIVVISVMVSGAWAVFRNPETRRATGWVILLGATFFYLSDIFVARDRFISDEFLNRLLGLPLYYYGQFLLAFSVGLVRQGPNRSS
jgi:uncharacterized membrane protein YhhN